MNLRWKKRIARLSGTWGVAFFGPLLSGNIAESIYNVGLSFEMLLTIAALSSSFQLGLVISQEAKAYGKGV